MGDQKTWTVQVKTIAPPYSLVARDEFYSEFGARLFGALMCGMNDPAETWVYYWTLSKKENVWDFQ